MRSRQEIEEQLHLAADQVVEGRSKFSGMTYEEGVDNALRWALEDSDDKPMEE